jgi:hypothetical protein
MGVKSCHRNGCERIMCDTYVPAAGYVCYDCQKEFENFLMNNGYVPQNENDITECLKAFMKTYKSSYSASERMSVQEYFNSYTH